MLSKHEFIRVLPALIHGCKDYFSPSACLYPPPLTVRSPTPTCHQMLNFSVLVCTRTGFKIADLYLDRKQLFQLEHSVYGQFLLPLVFMNSTHFQSYLGQHLPPPHFSEVVLCTYDTVTFFCHILQPILGFSKLPHFVCVCVIKVHSLCCKFRCVFTNA